MNEQLAAVIAANKARQLQARDLNARSGEMTFPVLTREELAAWLQEKLAGATSVATIKDLERLRLPALDTGLVELVIRENPDQVRILDRDFAVIYREGVLPQVRMHADDIVLKSWQQLPDAGVRLPSGRVVSVAVVVGWNTVSDSDIPQLKCKMRDHLNGRQWDNWQKPEITVPDLGADGATIPEIIMAQYGACVVDGTPLNAYGTLIVNPYRSYSNDPWFRIGWFRIKEEAEQARTTAVAKLESIRVEERQRCELETVKATTVLLQERLDALYRVMQRSESVDRTLQQRVYDRRYYDYPPSDLVGLGVWNAVTKQLISEVEGVVAEEEARLARRTEVQSAVAGFGRPKAHVYIDADGTAFVNRGIENSERRLEVDPRGVLEDRKNLIVTLDAERTTRVWQRVPTNTQVTCREYNRAGVKKSEKEFVIPSGLSTGVWAVGEDEQGRFFYPVFYFRNGIEVVPEEVKVVREPQVREDERKAAAVDGLLTKWGSGNRTPPRTKSAGRR